MPRRGAVVSIDGIRRSQCASIRDAVLASLDELYRFALHMTRHGEHARELVQESILRALERESNLVREPRAWLFQTLYHTLVSQYRKGLRREMLSGDSVNRDAATESAVDPLPALIAVEDVRSAIENLPEEFRAVVWLSDAEQFSLREISEILNCPIGTVASRLARGRRDLRRLLSAYGPAGQKSS